MEMDGDVLELRTCLKLSTREFPKPETGEEMVDLRKLKDVEKRLGEAVLDPLRWPVLMEDICAAVGATGAAMLQSEVRTKGIPLTASVAEYFQQSYFKNNLHVSDVRAARGVPLLLAGKKVVTDADLFGSETEML